MPVYYGIVAKSRESLRTPQLLEVMGGEHNGHVFEIFQFPWLIKLPCCLPLEIATRDDIPEESMECPHGNYYVAYRERAP